MATADRTLMLKLIADVNQPTKQIKGLGATLKKSAGAVKSWGKAFGGALVIGGIENVVSSLGDAWEGFREGEKVAGQLGNTFDNLGLSNRQLAKSIDTISAASKRLGVSDDEAIAAFNRDIQTTHNVRESMRRLRIAQDLVANGSAPNLKAAFKLINQAAKGSAATVDRFGLNSKTAGGRVAELGRKVKGAADTKAKLDPLGVFFNALSEDLETIVGSLSTGDIEGALQGLSDIGADLDKLWGSVGPKIIAVLDRFTGGSASQFLTDLGRALDAVRTAAQPALDLISNLWNDAIKPFIDGLNLGGAPAAGVLLAIAAGITALVLPTVAATLPMIALALAIAGVVVVIAEIVKHLPDIQHALQDAQKAIQPVLDGISQAFETTLGHIRNGIDLVKGVIQTLIDAWNRLQTLLNPTRSTMADALRVWLAQHGKPTGGHGGGFAEGGISPGGWAMVGEEGAELVKLPRGAQVFPAGETAAMMGGGDAWGGIVVNITTGVGDPVAIGREVDRVLRAYRGRAGGAA